MNDPNIHRTPNPHTMSRSCTRDSSRAALIGCLVSIFHMRDMCMWLKAQGNHSSSVVSPETFAFTLSAVRHAVHLL